MYKVLIVVLTLMTSAAVSADETAHTIRVNGIGSAPAAPDRALLNMSIVVRGTSLDVAQDQAAQVSQKILAITDALEIARKRVDTTGASVRPDYRYDREKGEQVFRGYIAERRIAVEFRDLDKLAPVIEGAVAAGVNQVSAPQLFSSKQREAYRKALDKAARDARANAAQLADSLGVKLGDAISIDAAPGASPIHQPGLARAMAVESDASASYNVGDQTIRAAITAVFEIDD